MGATTNQMAVEILCKMTEKLKRACSRGEMKADQNHKERNGKEQKS